MAGVVVAGDRPPGGRERARRLALALATVFVLALTVRLAAVVWLGGWAPQRNDRTLRYEPIASSLLAGQGFAIDGRPVASAPPAYPLLLAAVYSVTGPSATAARSVLAVIDAAGCLLLVLVARWLLDERTALITGLALALCPYLVYHVLTAGNDTLFVFFHGLFLLAWVASRRRPAAWRWSLVGVALALATLTRAVSLLMPLPVIGLTLLDHRRDLRRGLMYSVLFAACFAAVLAPWTVRNFVQFSRFVPVQTLGGYHLLLATGGSAQGPPRPPSSAPLTRGSRDVEVDASYYRRAVRRILDHPTRYVRGMARRALEMWYRTDSGRFQGALAVANAGLLLLAALGFVLARSRWRGLLPAVVVVGYYIALHAFLFAMFRYLLPAVPVLVMLAAMAVGALLARLLRPSAGRPAPPAATPATERR